MQVDFKQEGIEPCQCGFKPDHFTMGYGRTPYDIWCPVCKKQAAWAKCKVTGHHNNIVDYWNKVVSKMTLEQMKAEVAEFRIEQKANTGYDMYKTYEYYWVKGKGAQLHASPR